MTWNHDAAAWLANQLDESSGADPPIGQVRYDAAAQLRAATTEIDRLNKVIGGRGKSLELIHDMATKLELREEQIDKIADALGDESEWTSLSDRGDNALDAAHRLTAERDFLRRQLTEAQQRIENQEQWLRWPNHNMHEPVAKLYAEHLPYGDARHTIDKFKAVVGKMAADLAATQQRIAELELDNGALTALHADLGTQLERERKVHDYNRSLLAQSNADHNALVVEKARLTAILRAVYPVYRAAMAWREADRIDRSGGTPPGGIQRTESVLADLPDPQLTPDLLAVLEAMGLKL